MSNIRTWLEALDFGEYAGAFETENIPRSWSVISTTATSRISAYPWTTVSLC